MNFITYERAYCLYPVETLELSTSLLLVDENSYVEDLIVKYGKRGFTFYRVAYDDQFRHKDARWVEDRHTFFLLLPRFRWHSEVEMFIDPIRVTSWSITTSPFDNHSIHYLKASYGRESGVYPVVVFSELAQGTLIWFAAVGSPEWSRIRELLVFASAISSLS